MFKVGGTKSWSTVASTSTSSSTDYSSARATSPGRPDSRTDIYDSPRRFSIATSMTSVETFRLDEHFEQAAHQDELAHIKKRFSSYSHSSVESHSEPETPSRRLIVTLPPDANINSTEAAKALSMSLSFGSSHDGTQGWVEKQRQANTRGSQAMEETIQGEETPREDVCFQPGTALLQTGVGAINSGHLSPIDEVQSDAGCSLQASTVMGYDPQGNPITKSPTSEPRSRNSTEATSVSEDFADPIEPDETSETDEYSETNDSEDLSMFSLDSSLDPRIRELLLTLKDSVVSLVLQSLQDWIQSYSPDQDAGANFFDGQSGAGSTPNEDDDSARGDKEGGAKRRRDNDGGNGSGRDNNDEADKRRKTGLSSTREKAVEIFACHFVKRYPDEEWPSKCKNGWSEIPRLKFVTHNYALYFC
ncbi:hypothetical protein B0I35DRAFT_267041 [Stachybotrys elegans]|uniref:Uncharacterized protein n=1 Tax=Stachybotrys elegans TaxID=80388 RepID=A0A8K0WQQ3_9HYPO|nr:hypothetical protein B0I35DRAFT_267041 [Stachybotrys elegans]